MNEQCSAGKEIERKISIEKMNGLFILANSLSHNCVSCPFTSSDLKYGEVLGDCVLI